MYDKTIVAKDILTKDYISIGERDSLDNAIALLVKKNIGNAIVVNKEGCVVGTLSHIDAIRPYAADIYFNAATGQVFDFMNKTVCSLNLSSSLSDIAESFVRSNCSCIAVVDDGKVVGVVFKDKALKALMETKNKIEKENYTPQDPVVGEFGKKFDSEGGSALPGGFEGVKKK